jgi:carbon-monoxide dehydrogenase large subunit
MSILGNAVRRVEDPRLLTEGGRYVDDIPCEGALHAVFVRSTVAHATLTEIKTDDAEKAQGVVTAYTAAGLDMEPFFPPEFASLINTAMVRPWLAGDVVRFVGEPVAMVVANTRAGAVDAAELVSVGYDPLPAVVDVNDAVEDTTVLFPDAGTNVASAVGGDPTDGFFEGCDVVVRARALNNKVAAVPLEPRAALSTWTEDGRLLHWTGTQRPHSVRNMMATILGVAPEAIRLVAEDVGGAFGTRMYPSAEEVLVAWAARRLGQPVRWVETRTENLLALGHGRAQVQDVELGGTQDGRIIAYRLRMLQDAGAYPEVAALLPGFTALMAPGVYDIARVEASARSVVTNTAPVTAFRGAGRPEATAGVERAVELYAAEIGMDPAEVRRRNAIPADAFPFTTATGMTYDSGAYHAILDLALDRVDYAAIRRRQAGERARGAVHRTGVGVCLYTEITNGTLFPQFAQVDVGDRGQVTVYVGENPTGQGHATAWTALAGDRLGVDPALVTVVHGDTDRVRDGTGTGGSSALQTGGLALLVAMDDVIDQGRRSAAGLLEASVDDVRFDKATGRFHVAGTPAVSRGWRDLGGDQPLTASFTFTPTAPTFPFGCHIVVVDVDTETGAVTLERVVAYDDAGTILNPLLAEGQLHGGIAQGLAQALMEEVRYDADGNLLTATYADYPAISAAELPSFELAFTETPADNPLGAKGIGESGTIGSSPALLNAVVDALSPFGVRHLDMPVTPEKVWRAIQRRPRERA